MNERRSQDGKTTYLEAGGGLPLVLLHGFPLSKAMWRPQIEALAPWAHVFAPDLPGFGGTQRLAGTPSVEGMADRVADWLDAMSVREPVVLAGLSMGGYVTLTFARRHAARVRALVLADTKADPDDEAVKTGRDKMIALAKESGPEAVVEQMMPKMLGADTATRGTVLADELRSIAKAQSSAGVIDALQAMRDRPDAKTWLGTISVPTLVVVGEQDTLTPPERSVELVRAIGGAELVRIASAGHMSNLEQAEAFNEALGAFLRRLA
jgi:pimeloyl-ACP methyl ester carboxylesterase